MSPRRLGYLRRTNWRSAWAYRPFEWIGFRENLPDYPSVHLNLIRQHLPAPLEQTTTLHLSSVRPWSACRPIPIVSLIRLIDDMTAAYLEGMVESMLHFARPQDHLPISNK